uniref:Uncharacterized protein n=1 Tax=Chromera velia CCMP2878 TaxID=1169474 RepID=A0A0G4HWP9_9ALVE|eukprot:Cvel_9085.t1-p1 / transcript=Cvel_9085.t1 / gene=Cvel_9085 / organism=Chromera_velia_CCMP2878 / gene_product=hypothetical protein / transcript_product=hypothetical protein / location=Cvel_scaffold515:71068-76669(-) / protein_length=1247 / sequence_SO=supercontig / SO=protein_coding / is_pseudo=false
MKINFMGSLSVPMRVCCLTVFTVALLSATCAGEPQSSTICVLSKQTDVQLPSCVQDSSLFSSGSSIEVALEPSALGSSEIPAVVRRGQSVPSLSVKRTCLSGHSEGDGKEDEHDHDAGIAPLRQVVMGTYGGKCMWTLVDEERDGDSVSRILASLRVGRGEFVFLPPSSAAWKMCGEEEIQLDISCGEEEEEELGVGFSRGSTETGEEEGEDAEEIEEDEWSEGVVGCALAGNCEGDSVGKAEKKNLFDRRETEKQTEGGSGTPTGSGGFWGGVMETLGLGGTGGSSSDEGSKEQEEKQRRPPSFSSLSSSFLMDDPWLQRVPVRGSPEETEKQNHMENTAHTITDLDSARNVFSEFGAEWEPVLGEMGASAKAGFFNAMNGFKVANESLHSQDPPLPEFVIDRILKFLKEGGDHVVAGAFDLGIQLFLGFSGEETALETVLHSKLGRDLFATYLGNAGLKFNQTELLGYLQGMGREDFHILPSRQQQGVAKILSEMPLQELASQQTFLENMDPVAFALWTQTKGVDLRLNRNELRTLVQEGVDQMTSWNTDEEEEEATAAAQQQIPVPPSVADTLAAHMANMSFPDQVREGLLLMERARNPVEFAEWAEGRGMDLRLSSAELEDLLREGVENTTFPVPPRVIQLLTDFMDDLEFADQVREGLHLQSSSNDPVAVAEWAEEKGLDLTLTFDELKDLVKEGMTRMESDVDVPERIVDVVVTHLADLKFSEQVREGLRLDRSSHDPMLVALWAEERGLDGALNRKEVETLVADGVEESKKSGVVQFEVPQRLTNILVDHLAGLSFAAQVRDGLELQEASKNPTDLALWAESRGLDLSLTRWEVVDLVREGMGRMNISAAEVPPRLVSLVIDFMSDLSFRGQAAEGLVLQNANETEFLSWADEKGIEMKLMPEEVIELLGQREDFGSLPARAQMEMATWIASLPLTEIAPQRATLEAMAPVEFAEWATERGTEFRLTSEHMLELVNERVRSQGDDPEVLPLRIRQSVADFFEQLSFVDQVREGYPLRTATPEEFVSWAASKSLPVRFTEEEMEAEMAKDPNFYTMPPRQRRTLIEFMSRMNLAELQGVRTQIGTPPDPVRVARWTETVGLDMKLNRQEVTDMIRQNMRKHNVPDDALPQRTLNYMLAFFDGLTFTEQVREGTFLETATPVQFAYWSVEKGLDLRPTEWELQSLIRQQEPSLGDLARRVAAERLAEFPFPELISFATQAERLDRRGAYRLMERMRERLGLD